MNIFDLMRSNADPAAARDMSSYMKNQFEFLGIKRPERNSLQKPFIAEMKKQPGVDVSFIQSCWAQKEREFQYLGMDYYRSVIRYAQPGQLSVMEQMIVQKSWWDTVDFIASNLVGALIMQYPEVKIRIVPWIEDQNMWLRRTSLLFQLKYGTETDTGFLESAIKANLGSGEFFINKAIGWSLRQYSKTNPDWVRGFIATHDLAPLSRREASKYI